MYLFIIYLAALLLFVAAYVEALFKLAKMEKNLRLLLGGNISEKITPKTAKMSSIGRAIKSASGHMSTSLIPPSWPNEKKSV